ncbi:hypothetical protein GCM10023196_000970 [Actinoallomurus vinaceus]|uniref:Uncharacterized protein n=1 Tax=Actinoallomurus vinaceus TaxID=1080074 RepID=A0ABP8U1Z6_9ACTN
MALQADLVGELGHGRARAGAGLELFALELVLEQAAITSVGLPPDYGVGRGTGPSTDRVDEEEFLLHSHGANIHYVLLCWFSAMEK